MPLSEFLRMASQQNESDQHKQFSTDLASRSDSDIVELLWEDGQIMMQGQSSRATKPPLNTFPSSTNKPRTGKLSGVDSIPQDMSRITVPSQELDLSQDNDMDSWFDSLTHEGSVFLPEISGVAPNTDEMFTQNSFSLVEKRGNYGKGVSNLQQSELGSSKASCSKARQLCSWPPPLPHHHQTSSALGSGVSGVVNNMGSHSRPDVLFGSPAQSRDIRPPINNSVNYLNFSHFARSANLVKANASNTVKEKSSGGNGNGNGVIPKVAKSRLVEGFTSVSSGKSVVTKAIKDSCSSENLCQETAFKNDDPSTQSNAIESAKGVPCRERIVEHVVASSSVGSGNSADRVSCEQTHNSKRKYRDAEDSEDRSEDVGVEKTTLAGGNGGSKRSRAAEVHNLSERRRRDRINEKMRALQELIPNSNKADKASMLDEAIEYLKTLQHQVQVMSMGAGLCMPQMMFPSGIQHMHPPRIPHFSPMGPAGMGMGIGFGMGVLDINSGYPVFPVSSLHPPHFSTSLPTNFHRIPSPNLPVYGHPIPLSGQPSHVNSVLGLSGLRNGILNTVPGTSPVLNSGDVTNMNSPSLNCYAEANQVHATEEVLNQSAAAQEKEH